IVCFARERGRKASIAKLAQIYDSEVVDAENQVVGVAHADCPEDAQALIQLLNRNHPPKQILNVCYEPVTGAHVGPGALALFFMSARDVRERLAGN
ncbi:MAG: DegV family protein, partial [Candidatus Faecivicinus sp.]|nr:DegV family protein [Candidatus Faecivicinus sp.]